MHHQTNPNGFSPDTEAPLSPEAFQVEVQTTAFLQNHLYTIEENPFRTFWMAGFECSDQLNSSGDRVDLLEVTGHLDLVREDYNRVRSLGIQTVREGIRWSVVEYLPYHYNFDAVAEMMLAADETGIQQIWDICHFGYPADLSPLHPHFTPRFVALCEAFTVFYTNRYPDKPLFVTPVNEVSFICWLGGEVAGTVPYAVRNGWEVKYALMRAYIAAAKAMKQLSTLVRIVTTEPLANVVPGIDPTEMEIARAAIENEYQFQSVDMLCGRICPELGGSEDLVDVLGFNYYYNNQWVADDHTYLGWNDAVPDPRWRRLADLLEPVYQRYNKPILLSETSHPKEDRPIWIEMIANECAELISRGVPLLGVCLYPIIDRPDWDNLDIWHHAGIWDTDFESKHSRILHEPSERALLAAQQIVAESRKIARA